MSAGEKTNRESAYMDISSHVMTRHDTEAIDKNVYQAIGQTFKVAVSNKEQYYA